LGDAIQELGGDIGEISREMKADQLKQDTLRAEEAWNRLRAYHAEIKSGKEGYQNILAGDAISRPLMNEYGSMLSARAMELEQTLKTPKQRELFKRRSDVEELNLKEGVLQHTIGQRSIYETETVKNTVTAGNQEIQNNPTRQTVVTEMNRLKSVLDNTRLDQTNKDLILKNALSEGHRTVIGQLMAGDRADHAEVYFRENSKEIVDRDGKIADSIDIASTRKKSNDIANKLMATNNYDYGLVAEKLRNRKDISERVREQSIAKAKQIATDIDYAERDRLGKSFSTAMQYTQSGREVPAEILAEIKRSPEAEATLGLMREELRTGETPKSSDASALAVWNRLDFNSISRMTDAEFYPKYWTKMTTEDRTKAVNLREAAVASLQKQDKEATVKLEEHVSFEQRMFDTLESHKLIKPNKNSKTGERELTEDDKLFLNDFRREADQEIADWQRANGSKYVPGEIKQKIMDKLAATKYMKANVKGIIWDTSGVPVRTMTQEQYAKAYVPIEHISRVSISKMYNYARSEGLIPRSMSQDIFVSKHENRIERAKFADSTGARPDEIRKILAGEQ